jgi:chorismate dehydratase
MQTPRISASSYSNTAPLIWSFLYGSNHGKVELILDNAPARSAELLEQDRVDAALVPVIAYQTLPDVKLIPNVCVGAKERVRSVCLVTRGIDLADARSVALDVSSRTSVALVKIIFREFMAKEPEFKQAQPMVDEMLSQADAALIIGDPALSILDFGFEILDSKPDADKESKIQNRQSKIRKFDLAELWKRHTGLGFIFAMWMTRRPDSPIDFAAARDEGLLNADSIAASYAANLPLSQSEIRDYLTQNISFTPDESMLRGMELYFELAQKHKLIESNKELVFV